MGAFHFLKASSGTSSPHAFTVMYTCCVVFNGLRTGRLAVVSLLRGCDPKLLTPPQFSTLGLPHQGPRLVTSSPKTLWANWLRVPGCSITPYSDDLQFSCLCYPRSSGYSLFPCGIFRLELDHFHSPSCSTRVVLHTIDTSHPGGPTGFGLQRLVDKVVVTLAGVRVDFACGLWELVPQPISPCFLHACSLAWSCRGPGVLRRTPRLFPRLVLSVRPGDQSMDMTVVQGYL